MMCHNREEGQVNMCRAEKTSVEFTLLSGTYLQQWALTHLMRVELSWSCHPLKIPPPNTIPMAIKFPREIWRRHPNCSRTQISFVNGSNSLVD
jgi:hypothetical protein